MPRRTLALLDDSEASGAVLAHAIAAARALDTPLTLVRAIEGPNGDAYAPVDAVEWSLRRNRTALALERDAAEARRLGVETHTAVLHAPDLVGTRRLLVDEAVALAVIPGGPVLGPAQQAILDAAAQSGASLLLVPTTGARAAESYRHILVALDCSSHSVGAVDLASTLARSSGAELVLAHIVPVPEMPRLGVPYTLEERGMRRAVVRRNERVAQAHLGRLGAELASRGVSARLRTVSSGRIGPSIADLVREERPDLVAIGASGHGSNEVASAWPYGSVARSLMAHLAAPLLIHRAQRIEPTRDFARPTATRHALNVPRFIG